jgi:hypothetical protein
MLFLVFFNNFNILILKIKKIYNIFLNKKYYLKISCLIGLNIPCIVVLKCYSLY